MIEEKSQEIISNELPRHKYKINIILIGPQGVGKSSLIERIIKDSFDLYILPTVGCDFKQVNIDLKDHSSIIYKFIDVCGQECFFRSWMDYLDIVDIIIFVNDQKGLEVNTLEIIKERVLLSDKKVICCINKKDILSDGEIGKTLKNFKEINSELKDKPIILVSAKTSDGIKELKNKIRECSLNIIKEKKIAEIQKSKKLNRINIKLDPERNDKKHCC